MTWWLKKDCRKCVSYPDCDGVETKSKKPRGCSSFKEKALMTSIRCIVRQYSKETKRKYLVDTKGVLYGDAVGILICKLLEPFQDGQEIELTVKAVEKGGKP